MAGFLGTGVPVWDSDTVYTKDDNQDFLVRNTRLGVSLAKSLCNCLGELKHSVALMRGHGMVVTAESIEMCIFNCIYTAQNAEIQKSAMGLGGSMKLFTEREARDTNGTTGQGVAKPWPLWKREVEDSSLYHNLA
jgi:ribulose-5-phosphate 4-epimerase/fuculose-1-phosphate aldolase